jgi:hypothetical protein
MNRFRLAVVTAALAAPLGALAPLGAAASAQAADSPVAAGAGAPLIPVAASSAMSGGGPASGGPGTAGCANLATSSNFHERLVSQAVLPLEQLPASAVSVPTWSGSFTTGGTAYPFTMVGSDPAAGQATHVPVEIIPLILDFAGNGCVLQDSGMAADLEASPLFTPTDLPTGVTQYVDDYQRSNFWSTVSTTSPGYHLLLDPSDIPAVTLHVPAAQGIMFLDTNTNLPYGIVGGDWFFHQLLGLINSLHISPTTLPVFVPYNTAVTDQNPNDCLRPPYCAHYTGYHYAVLSNNNPHAINTFIMASYQDFGTSSTYDLGTEVLSHELLEWSADPFDNYSSVQNPGAAASIFMNTAPAWSSPYYGNYCATPLEVADTLEGGPWLVAASAPKYLLANAAFLSWFARQSPSTAIGGLYDLGGIFSTYSTAC